MNPNRMFSLFTLAKQNQAKQNNEDISGAIMLQSALQDTQINGKVTPFFS